MNNGAKKNAQTALKALVENTSRYNGTQESDSISQVTKEQFGTFNFYTILPMNPTIIQKTQPPHPLKAFYKEILKRMPMLLEIH
jgi:hypothetical protein